MVRGQSSRHQAIEDRITELAPPPRIESLLHNGKAVGVVGAPLECRRAYAAQRARTSATAPTTPHPGARSAQECGFISMPLAAWTEAA
jgi:hypothetical protein